MDPGSVGLLWMSAGISFLIAPTADLCADDSVRQDLGCWSSDSPAAGGQHKYATRMLLFTMRS